MEDLIAIRRAILEKIAEMQGGSGEVSAFGMAADPAKLQKLADDLQAMALAQQGGEGFKGTVRPEHASAPKLVEW